MAELCVHVVMYVTVKRSHTYTASHEIPVEKK